MNQTEIFTYVEKYLQTQECQIMEKGKGYLTTKLSIHADKDIANRPYYWMFQERTGAEAQTLTLTFIFEPEHVDEEQIQGELIQFGCWRLHQIFQSAKKNGQFIRLYEDVHPSSTKQALIPWLLVNYTISFISDQKKDIFFPLGINLVTGHILNHFDSILQKYRLTPKIPDYHFTMSPIFSFTSAIGRMEEHIYEFLEKEDATWFKEANQRLDEEKEIIHSFFTDEGENTKDTLNKRLQEVEYYRPRIKVNPINVGIIYLQTHP